MTNHSPSHAPLTAGIFNDELDHLITVYRDIYRKQQQIPEVLYAITSHRGYGHVLLARRSIGTSRYADQPAFAAFFLHQHHAVAALWVGTIPYRPDYPDQPDLALATGGIWPAGDYRATRTAAIQQHPDGTVSLPDSSAIDDTWLDWLDTALRLATQ